MLPLHEYFNLFVAEVLPLCHAITITVSTVWFDYFLAEQLKTSSQQVLNIVGC